MIGSFLLRCSCKLIQQEVEIQQAGEDADVLMSSMKLLMANYLTAQTVMIVTE
jgi:hypothetical protein